LVQHPAVQEELKLKESQKAKLKSLADEMTQRMRVIGDRMNPGWPGRSGRRVGNQNASPNAAAGRQGGRLEGGGFGGGQDPNPVDRGDGNPDLPGSRNRGQPDPGVAQRRSLLREAMDELNLGAEQAFARILDRSQYARLKQIQLQDEGPSALLRPDLQERLNMDEDQVEQVRELMNERDEAQRETRMAQGELMKSAFPKDANPNPGNNGQNGGTRGILTRLNDPAFQEAMKKFYGQNGGTERIRTRLNDPAFQEAMKKFWESPETKAKMEEFRRRDEQIENRFMAAAKRVLSRRQSAAYEKMLGAPFDLSKLRGNPPWDRDVTANRAGTSETGSRDEAETTTAKSSTKSGNSPSADRPKRKSLRERRGIPDKSD
jgi:hypothetical protein